MANPYRELFSVPGARPFVVAGFLGRMPMSMTGLGIVLMVSSVTGSYGIAGAVSATCAVAFGVASPVIGRLSDVHGQDRVLYPLVVLYVTSMAVLVLCGVLSTPTWTYFPPALAVGLFSPAIGAMVRARWSHLLAGSPLLHTAFSFESVADELIFVTGPMLATALATGVRSWAGLAAAGAICLVGTVWFASRRDTQPPLQARQHTGVFAVIRIPALAALAAVFLCLGTVFGAVDVITVAFSQEHGHQNLAGVLLGCYAFGSGSGGLWYGARHWRRPLDSRFRITLGLMITGLVPIALVSRITPDWGLFVMMPVLFVSGTSISPTLIAGFALVERVVPIRQLTEGLTWISTSIGFGVATGSTIAGRLVDGLGAADAYVFALTAGILAVLVGVGGQSRFRKSVKHELPS